MSQIVSLVEIITSMKQEKERLNLLQRDLIRSIVKIDDIDNIHIDQDAAKKIIEIISACKQNLGECEASLCNLAHDKSINWGELNA